MKTKVSLAIVSLALMIAGLVLSGPGRVSADQSQPTEGYICPITGDKLPCPDCCPARNG